MLDTDLSNQGELHGERTSQGLRLNTESGRFYTCTEKQDHLAEEDGDVIQEL